MSFKEKVFSDPKTRFEEINRFRVGDITQHLTSVDAYNFIIGIKIINRQLFFTFIAVLQHDYLN